LYFNFISLWEYKLYTIMNNLTANQVVDWAIDFLKKADEELTQEEVKEQKKYASLITTPEYKTFLTTMLDESSQIRDSKKLNKRVRQIIQEYGIPDFFGSFDRVLLKLYMSIGHYFPYIAIPILKQKLRQETNKIIIAEERPKLTQHLKSRTENQIGQNVNLLGEVVLGDGEANNRYQHYLEALEEPDINYISIKLSGIYAQIHSLSYEQNKKDLIEMVANIYQKAIDNPYIENGKPRAKFVNLDMEEYKDVELTIDVFLEVMSLPQFKNYTAGLVIQAYLPDAEGLLNRLLAFARKRVEEGGALLKVRLVKGANLQMESVISSLKGWENPIYKSKVEVDANYLHLLDIALKPENAQVCHVGVASHNYFTIAYAHLLGKENGVSECVTFEMLEGMANNLPRVMRKMEKQIILYTPVVKAKSFLNAISYLVRRLDENTGKDNFLSYSFNLQLDSPQWIFLRDQFIQAFTIKDTVRTEAFRKQNRNEKPEPVPYTGTFKNEPDTDLDLPWNREWALNILNKWEKGVSQQNFIVPVQIGEKEVTTEHKKLYKDKSKEIQVTFCEANLATDEQVKEIIVIAEKDVSEWRKTPLKKRADILYKVADKLAAKRGELIGCMSSITGKTFTEGDVEASEAIDFCRYYPTTMQAFEDLEGVTYTPKGIVLVIPPWNFPLAIPVGGVASALSGGNTVILKPATVALPVAWEFAKCFWEAGVPKDALQVVCPADRNSLNELTSHPSIKHIILTGGTDTAFRLLKNSPRTPLSAETGGKNAIILTGNGDQDHAILNIVSSAFSNAGQKCSACSLLLLDKKIYEDEAFRNKLKDAVLSMHTGSVWDTMNVVGPMIDNDNEKLLHAINNLEAGEFWLVPPVFADESRYILKPTVKWGVKPGSFTFVNELFAPLLSVVCIDNLEQGLEFANSSAYGLTAGLQSLNQEEQQLWKNTIEAGNLYINRGITGAIVNRQPFGGMKRSAFGGGIKAGGPNYVSCFVEFEERDYPEGKLNFALDSYQKAWKEVFSKEEDINHIYGEQNTFRYLPLKSMAFRIHEEDKLTDVLMILNASIVARTPLIISIDTNHALLEEIKKAIIPTMKAKIILQDEKEFLVEMNKCERIRTCSPELSDAFYARAAELGKHIAYNKPMAEGRLELLHYLKEQSISFEYHRYGSIFGEEA